MGLSRCAAGLAVAVALFASTGCSGAQTSGDVDTSYLTIDGTGLCRIGQIADVFSALGLEDDPTPGVVDSFAELANVLEQLDPDDLSSEDERLVAAVLDESNSEVELISSARDRDDLKDALLHETPAFKVLRERLANEC